jgi:hypothetical protein
MVQEEPEKVIGGKDEPSINRSVGIYEEGLPLRLGGELPLFTELPRRGLLGNPHSPSPMQRVPDRGYRYSPNFR